MGRLSRVVDPLGTETRTSYDAARRVVCTEGPRPGAVETRTYTPAGRPLTITDATGAVTRYAYAAAGRAVSVTEADATPVAVTTATTSALVPASEQRTQAGKLSRFDSLCGLSAGDDFLVAPSFVVRVTTWTC